MPLLNVKKKINKITLFFDYRHVIASNSGSSSPESKRHATEVPPSVDSSIIIDSDSYIYEESAPNLLCSESDSLEFPLSNGSPASKGKKTKRLRTSEERRMRDISITSMFKDFKTVHRDLDISYDTNLQENG